MSGMPKHAIIIVLWMFGVSWSTVIDVPGEYPTIQYGINASFDGDTVLVQPGIYVENINFNGHNIVLGSLFLTTGDTSYISQTVINGDSAGSVVIFESGEDSSAVIIGFILEYGYSVLGGGIFCTNNSNPIITYNEIRDNGVSGSGYRGGGGIHCDHSDPVMRNNLIHHNSALWGAGIDLYFSNASIYDNLIVENYSYGDGGGFSIHHSSPFIDGCTIAGNTGEGIYFAASYPIIINTIVWGNAWGAVVGEDSDATVTYSCIEDGWAGSSNTESDPLFADFGNGDFNICTESPCFDGGDPNSTDPDGSRKDIGYFFPEHPHCLDGNVWHVSVNGSDSTGDGSYSNPFRTIQHGIDYSYHGDTVLIANGEYDESLNIRSKNIVLTSHYIYSEDTLDINNTIINAGYRPSAITVEFCDSSSSIIGITIKRGYNSSYGGGICCRGSDINILHNLIIDNLVIFSGGGIDCYRSNPTIEGNIIMDNINSGNQGGGIGMIRSNPIIKRNLILQNAVNSVGGGIYIGSHSVPQISNNIISENVAQTSGGGIYINSPNQENIIISNNIIYHNRGYVSGGGIYFYNSDAIIINNIIWNNISQNGQIYLYESEPTITYSDIQGGWSGIGNIDIYPYFRDPDFSDFHLQSTVCGDPYNSPCIDAGDPSIQDIVIDCNWGMGTIASDMGAYGGGDSTMLDIEDITTVVPDNPILFQNFPNPFNGQTTIRFVLPESQNVKLTVYDLLGRRVETLIDGYIKGGFQAIIFDAVHFPSGVYFYRLRAGDMVVYKKMLLLK